MIDKITSVNLSTSCHMNNFIKGKEISYGQMNLKKSPEVQQHGKDITTKDKLLAAAGAITGVSIPLLTFMKRQKAPNIFRVKYKVQHMITMAACGNIGGILASSIGEPKEDIKKKWKEGAFQMVLTSAPLLLVDGSIALCSKSKNPKINNNITKIICSVLGVTIGSNSAAALFNSLRSEKEAKKPKRELKLKDMIANLDDAVAICVLAKIPFADKIHIERALPVIYSICGYRSGTGDRKRA
ncbi:MAG: hypothetical protein NC191_02830 [Muribaculaceae bacterium]|nr:hypothetical protein [Muribaculaceae bacterium]